MRICLRSTCPDGEQRCCLECDDIDSCDKLGKCTIDDDDLHNDCYENEQTIKVWHISHEIMGGGYISEEVDCFETDFKEELTCEARYKREDIAPFLEKVKGLEVGQSAELYPWKITCKEMTKEELDSLEEFAGW